MAGQQSAAITEQIRLANDIVDVVSSYVSLKRAGKDFKALCPFHSEKTPSFHAVPDKQIFKCFGCGAGGDVFKFIQLRENVDFSDARGILAARAGIEIQEERRSAARAGGPNKTELERANRWACRWFQEQLRTPRGEPARRYLETRGITEASVERFALGYAPVGWDGLCRAASKSGIPSQLALAAGLTKENTEQGRIYDAFRHRLMFPIRDAMDRTVGFGGRTLGDDTAKYVNSPRSPLFDKGRCLYGLDAARHAFRAGERSAIIVEGYTDCILAHQHGFGHTLATLGTALTPEHVRLLSRYVDTAILVFDSDAAGRKAADRAVELFLGESLDVRIAQVPDGKDPAEWLQEAGADAFRRVLTSASEALEFKWKEVVRQYGDVATGPGRRRAIEEFLGLIVRSADLGAYDPIQRGLIRNQIGKLLGLPSEEVERQLRIIARRSPRSRSVGGRPAAEVRPGTHDAASAATRHLLEVLLNEPSYYASIASEFDPDRISDTETRGIARAVAELARDDPGFSLPVLISRFESTKTAERILAMQTAGQMRGNFAATIEGAVQCLQKIREQRKIARLVAGLRDRKEGEPATTRDETSAGDGPAGAGADDQSVARAMSQGARQIHHFAARRYFPASFFEVEERRGRQSGE